MPHKRSFCQHQTPHLRRAMNSKVREIFQPLQIPSSVWDRDGPPEESGNILGTGRPRIYKARKAQRLNTTTNWLSITSNSLKDPGSLSGLTSGYTSQSTAGNKGPSAAVLGSSKTMAQCMPDANPTKVIQNPKADIKDSSEVSAEPASPAVRVRPTDLGLIRSLSKSDSDLLASPLGEEDGGLAGRSGSVSNCKSGQPSMERMSSFASEWDEVT
ncbi:hypothetical protein PAMP_017737 [Pampus punctatissimus]